MIVFDVLILWEKVKAPQKVLSQPLLGGDLAHTALQVGGRVLTNL